MEGPSHIPMFPLAILPLPGELVPLHIFEPRYKQLLQDAESEDINFGIYFSHTVNEEKIGSLMRLESVLKRYPGGEADIIVKCQDIFTMDRLLRVYKNKLYPGGDVRLWNVAMEYVPKEDLYGLFLEYLRNRKINQHFTTFTLYQIAQELSLDVHDRYKFLQLSDLRKEPFLLNRIRYQLYLLGQEEKSKDVYHLN